MTQNSPEKLRVLGLVDLHWTPKRRLELPDLEAVDLVLLGGDLTNFRGAAEAVQVIESVRVKGPQVLAVCGNCDRPEIEESMEDLGVALDRRARIVGGIAFVGLSAGLPFGGCPYERTETEYEEACRLASDALRSLEVGGLPWVLLSHQPPYGTRCDLARGVHVGSKSVRRFIASEQPELVLCGHIHEAIGSDRIGRSRIVNPGPAFAGHALRFAVSEGRIEID